MSPRKDGTTTRRSVSVKGATYARLDAYAADESRTVTAVVEQAITVFLDKEQAWKTRTLKVEFKAPPRAAAAAPPPDPAKLSTGPEKVSTGSVGRPAPRKVASLPVEKRVVGFDRGFER